MRKKFLPIKTQNREITLPKCPEKIVLHLHDDPTEFEMLLFKSWAEQDLMLQ